MSTINPAERRLYHWNKSQGLHGPGGEGFRAEARAADKKVASGRQHITSAYQVHRADAKARLDEQEIMSGLSAAEKSKMASFMGAVNTKARNMLEEVVRLIASSGKDPRMLMKKVLVHACANLDVDRCITFLEAMLRLGQDTALQLLWLYERYDVPNAGGGMTKCAANHSGRDLGVGKIEDILGLPDPDKKTFALQLSNWHPDRRVKVLRAWEATDPKMTAEFLLDLIREEQARGGGDTGISWVCSLCPIKREVEMEAKLIRGEHRRKDRTINAGVLYDNDSERIDVYRSPHESLFTLEPLRETYLRGRKRQDRKPRGEAGEQIVGNSPALEARTQTKASGATRVTGRNSCTWETSRRCHQPQSPSCLGTDMGGRGNVLMPLTPMYAGRTYDPRRLCWSCTTELRGAIIFHGHDLELWHKVDDERRELMELQRRNDLLKAQWARQEREERQVAELLRFIWEANLDSFSRHTLKERERVACSTKSEIGRLLDLNPSSQAAVKGDAAKNEGLKRLNQEEAKTWASTLRLKASLNIDSRYASLEPGLLPTSLDKRHNIPTKRSDFLAHGTPVTPQGAKQAFGRAETAADDTTGDICCWRSEARKKEKLLDRHREVHASQLSCEKRTRFSQLCKRWIKAAKRVEEKQRHKHMLKEMGREKRMREREAAKVEKMRQLDEFRSATEVRIAQEELYRLEKGNAVKEEKRQESQELEMMKQEEAAQLAGGDRYWGLIREIKRLRDIEQERRLAWEARIRETREKLVAVRCISKLSYFSHSNPPNDPDLARRIEALAAK